MSKDSPRPALLLFVPVLAACGLRQCETKINLYYWQEQNLSIGGRRLQHAGRRRVPHVYNLLAPGRRRPADPDGRRLAAKDSSMDILGWTSPGPRSSPGPHWIREWTGANATEAETGTLAGPLGHRQVLRQAVRGAEEHQRAVCLMVKTGPTWSRSRPTTWPRWSSSRASSRRRASRTASSPWRAVRGTGGALQLAGRLGRRAILNDAGTKAEFNSGASPHCRYSSSTPARG